MRALKFASKFLVIVLVGGAALGGAVALLIPAGATLRGSVTPLGKLDVTINAPAARSVVYDRNGNVMTTLFADNVDRSPVKLKDVPQVLIDAVLSIEDRKFYEHHGVDWGGTVRALFKNVDAGGITQGGSTITQQLVKNTLTSNLKRDLKTKVREAILAIRLEHELTKNQILEDYLNLIYFGNGAYGVQAAVERYFPNTPLKSLSVAQAALLAGLIQAPNDLEPIKHPDAAARRRSEVLDAMVANHKLSQAAADAAKAVPLPTKVSYPHAAPLDYYIDAVKTQLLSDNPNLLGDPGEVLGTTQQARANAVFRGGLRIYTSYDPGLQFLAAAAVRNELPQSPFTASLVVIDNSDGGVRAIANGRTFAQTQFDPATEGYRQAGSSFKAFTLAAALSRGYSPNDSVSGDPITWRTGPGSGSDAYYNLHGDCHGGTPSLYTAIAISDNCAFVRTELSLGPGHYGADGADIVVQTARSMGIDTSHFLPVVSTTLGTNGVHPLDMAEAYSVFPNDGVLKRATLITKIIGPTGRLIYQAPTVGLRVLDPNVARTEIDMLKGVLRNGTASRTLGNFPRPAAGKTGTTDQSQDAWFIGFTPQYTAAVWMGNPDGEIKMVINGSQVFGADYPARIWRSFMLAATAQLPPFDFPAPLQSLWPRPRFISERGRGFYSGSSYNNNSYAPPPNSPVSPPATSGGASPTTISVTPPPTVRRPPPTTVANPPATGPPNTNQQGP